MKDLATAIDEPATEQLTAEAEVITEPCPSCEKPVSREIPAGTPKALAEVFRKVRVVCTPCAEAEDERLEAGKAAAERRRREEQCELPRLLRGLSWESYGTERVGAEEAKAAAQEWAAGEHAKRGLMLIGPVGVGKTRLAATATWAALDRITVRYINVADLIVKMTAAFGDRDRTMALKLLTGRGAVVLDDLDKIKPSMTVLANLYTAIEGRVQAGAPIIVTTNLDPGQLVSKFATPARGEDPAERKVAAESIVSRLVGHCTIVAIEGKDGRTA